MPKLRTPTQVFDVGSRAVLRQLKGHQRPVHVARFSSDKLHALSGGDDATVGASCHPPLPARTDPKSCSTPSDILDMPGSFAVLQRVTAALALRVECTAPHVRKERHCW